MILNDQTLFTLMFVKKFSYVFFDNRKDNSRVRRQVNEKKFLSNNRT